MRCRKTATRARSVGCSRSGEPTWRSRSISRTCSGTSFGPAGARGRPLRPAAGARRPRRRATASSSPGSASSRDAGCSGRGSATSPARRPRLVVVHGFSSLLIEGHLPVEAGEAVLALFGRLVLTDEAFATFAAALEAERARGAACWTPTRSSSAPGSPGWSPPPSWPTPAAGSSLRRPGARGRSLGGQAFWSFGGLFLVDSPEQRRMRHQGLARPRPGRTGWAPRGFDRAARTTGRAGGPRPTSTSPPARSAPGCTAGRAVLPGRRLGRARRLPRRRPRQLGAPLPRHLGHRARGRGAVRAPGARGASTPAASSSGSATGSTR